MIRGILFDLGGTLIESKDPAEVIESFLSEEGITKSRQEIATAVSRAERSFCEDDFIGTSFWKEWNVRVLTSLGVVSERERLASKIDSEWFERAQVRPYPEVVDVLRQLKATDLRLGAVTNGMVTDIPHLIDEAGLGEFLQVRTSADAAGRRKPNPRIFLHAARTMALHPSDVMFVGDDLYLDYYPSQSVGMIPVLVNRRATETLVKNVIRDLTGIWTFL